MQDGRLRGRFGASLRIQEEMAGVSVRVEARLEGGGEKRGGEGRREDLKRAGGGMIRMRRRRRWVMGLRGIGDGMLNVKIKWKLRDQTLATMNMKAMASKVGCAKVWNMMKMMKRREKIRWGLC